MSRLEIVLREPRAAFRPGERLAGQARWELDRSPRTVEVRLLWFTRGAAIPESAVAQKSIFTRPMRAETRDFEFILPDGPYSYAGQYSFLRWGLELVTLPAEEHTLVEFCLSPSGMPVYLIPVVSERDEVTEDGD
jgi:hypothetical protein